MLEVDPSGDIVLVYKLVRLVLGPGSGVGFVSAGDESTTVIGLGTVVCRSIVAVLGPGPVVDGSAKK